MYIFISNVLLLIVPKSIYAPRHRCMPPGKDGKVRIWDWRSRPARVLRVFEGHTGMVSFSRDLQISSTYIIIVTTPNSRPYLI